METIYLDHNATTPMHPQVIEVMAQAQKQGLANPASQHQPGQRARRMLDDAREEIAGMLGARLSGPQADRLIFTSGGTESNNLAVLGIARARQPVGPGRLMISAVEHASVIGPAEALLDAGWRLDLAGVDSNGVIDRPRFRELLAPQTVVVSVILGNHDTGVLQPIAELAASCNALGIPLHTDAVQVMGKLPVDFRALGVAALSGAAHKFRGPLGIGLLLLRHDVTLEPLLYGGSQQGGVRPGTESVPLVLGMLTALRMWREQSQQHLARMEQLQQRFEAGVRTGCPAAVVHAASVPRLPNTSNIAFPGVDGQILLLALDMAGVACSVGSACSSGSSELSPTLRAMGLPRELVASSLRFSLGAVTTEADVDEAVRRFVHVCRELG